MSNISGEISDEVHVPHDSEGSEIYNSKLSLNKGKVDLWNRSSVPCLGKKWQWKI